MEASSVDLRDRGGGERLVIEFRKELTDRTLEAAFDLGDRLLGWEWSDVILQRLQGGDVVIRQQIATQAQRLAKLDERRPEPRQTVGKLFRRT
jgi:hypothetical protein